MFGLDKKLSDIKIMYIYILLRSSLLSLPCSLGLPLLSGHCYKQWGGDDDDDDDDDNDSIL